MEATVQVTIDSTEPLERVLPVVAALYGVDLQVVPGSGRRSGPTGRSRRTAGAGRSRVTGKGSPDAGVMRMWARANGHEVKDRGRVPDAVVAAFLADKGA